jgi:division/cell wall cluster transcriptional repressor MraZ|tara:strand:+ start:404 stop:838 length:435 start_codon:yes stop_codon:yes gene_type:complete
MSDFMFNNALERKLYSDGTCLVPCSKSSGSIIVDNKRSLLKKMNIVSAFAHEYNIVDVFMENYSYPESVRGERIGTPSKLELKSDTRIQIPNNLIKHAKLENSVYFVGCSDWFEIWNPKDWKDYCETYKSNETFTEIMEKYFLA